ncbi:MAG: hypothetical protein LBM07_05220 [Culturomica sp.]|jgi:hypothetical protein|nr:hypothetical protein [Culturomica sp.]
MKRILFSTWLLLFLLPLYSQEVVTPFSGLAGSEVSLHSAWSTYYNQAGLARIDGFSLGSSYRHVADVQELSLKTIFAAYPIGMGAFAANFTYFGYEHYNEQSLGVAYAKQLSPHLDVGIKGNYRKTAVAKQKEYSESLFFELGTIITFSDAVHLGVHASNPLSVGSEGVPEVYNAGISWQADKLFLLAGSAQMMDREISFSMGTEFNYTDRLQFSCGLRTSPQRFYAGVSVLIMPRLDISLQYNTNDALGNVFGVSISWIK